MNPAKQFLDLIMKPSEVDALFRDYILQEEDRRKGRQSLNKFGITKIKSDASNKLTQVNDTELNFDMYINKQAKPTNTIESKKSKLIKTISEEIVNNKGSLVKFKRLAKEDYTIIDTNADSDIEINDVDLNDDSDSDSDDDEPDDINHSNI